MNNYLCLSYKLLTKMTMYGAIIEPICAHVETIFSTVIRMLVWNCSLVYILKTTVDKCNKLLAIIKQNITAQGYSFGTKDVMQMATPINTFAEINNVLHFTRFNSNCTKMVPGTSALIIIK